MTISAERVSTGLVLVPVTVTTYVPLALEEAVICNLELADQPAGTFSEVELSQVKVSPGG
jgi:hypothetical protein